MKFKCDRYPQLDVHGVVKFVDGEADVTDKAAIDALKALPDEYGVKAATGGRRKSDEGDE